MDVFLVSKYKKTFPFKQVNIYIFTKGAKIAEFTGTYKGSVHLVSEYRV